MRFVSNLPKRFFPFLVIILTATFTAVLTSAQSFPAAMAGDYDGTTSVVISFCPSNPQTNTTINGSAKIHLNSPSNNAMAGTLTMRLPINGNSTTGVFGLTLTNPVPYPITNVIAFIPSIVPQTPNFILTTIDGFNGIWGAESGIAFVIFGYANYNGEQCFYQGSVQVEELPLIQLICRPLGGNTSNLNDLTFDIKNFVMPKLGRHCYFLVTKPDDTKLTIGAYPLTDLLTPDTARDSTTPRGGCISSDTDIRKSVCIELTSCSSRPSAYNQLVKALSRGPEGVYNVKTNNSNSWVKRRLQELECTETLPPSAPTNAVEYCSQFERVFPTLTPTAQDIVRPYILPCP